MYNDTKISPRNDYIYLLLYYQNATIDLFAQYFSTEWSQYEALHHQFGREIGNRQTHEE
jgi:hypothetical protein